MIITREQAQRVLDIVDQGLSKGLGDPVPGQMCVEAAVCFAFGLPHSDCPPCVSPLLRTIKIALNDRYKADPLQRATALRKLAILQLGTDVGFDGKEFLHRLRDKFEFTARKRNLELDPWWFEDTISGRTPVSLAVDEAVLDDVEYGVAEFIREMVEHTRDPIQGIELTIAAVEEVLVEMKVPGVQWLELL